MFPRHIPVVPGDVCEAHGGITYVRHDGARDGACLWTGVALCVRVVCPHALEGTLRCYRLDGLLGRGERVRERHHDEQLGARLLGCPLGGSLARECLRA